MTQQGDAVAGELATEKVGIKGYLAFFLTIIFFSGVFSGTDSWWRVFDFSVLNGSFGQLPGANGATTSFRGAGGTGAKDGFLFALELAPSVILSLGINSRVPQRRPFSLGKTYGVYMSDNGRSQRSKQAAVRRSG